MTISAVRDDKGNLRGFAKITQDMTERRRMEQEVQEQRSRALAAQLGLKERDEFISIAAHELRTPLTALQLRLQGMERALPETVTKSSGPKGGSNRLEGAIKQTKRLAELVERLLDVSRIVAGRLEMTMEEVELGELVRQVVDDFQEAAVESGSEIRFTAKHPVKGAWDRMRVQQVVANLLSNAVKYGAKNPIDVQVDDNGTLGRIVVADRGIGISAENIERIFNRFERAVPEQHFSGLGLGLYIARYIAVAHGGSVKAESAAGHGSRFVVELPKHNPLGGAKFRGKTVAGE
jgi:signal transduction histidine kinase